MLGRVTSRPDDANRVARMPLELWYARRMRTFLVAGSLLFFGSFGSGCAVETATHARIDDTDVTMTTFRGDDDADDEPTFGLQLGGDPGAFSFTVLAD